MNGVGSFVTGSGRQTPWQYPVSPAFSPSAEAPSIGDPVDDPVGDPVGDPVVDPVDDPVVVVSAKIFFGMTALVNTRSPESSTIGA